MLLRKLIRVVICSFLNLVLLTDATAQGIPATGRTATPGLRIAGDASEVVLDVANQDALDQAVILITTGPT